MLSHQRLKKQQLALHAKHKRDLALVLNALRAVDPSGRLLDCTEALTSRALIRELWDALPEERFALGFESPGAQTEQGARLLPADRGTRVTLHLGWDLLAFATTLEAAWNTWPSYCARHPDTFNACLYPDDLRWYVVRAGRNLYVMDCTRGEEPQQSPSAAQDAG